MSHQTKMLLRLAAPAVAVFFFGMLLAFVIDTVTSLPMLIGGQVVQESLENKVAIGTAAVSSLVYAIAMVRYWRWTRDEGDMCSVCGCLLGRERDGRYGPHRKCLGCAKNHAIGRL